MMFPEYGIPLRNLAWFVGEWVWLRLATGPRLVQVVAVWDRRSALVDAADMVAPLTVPAERLAASWVTAVRD